VTINGIISASDNGETSTIDGSTSNQLSGRTTVDLTTDEVTHFDPKVVPNISDVTRPVTIRTKWARTL